MTDARIRLNTAAKLKTFLQQWPQLHYAPGPNRNSNYIVNRFTGKRERFGLLKFLAPEHVEKIAVALTADDLPELFDVLVSEYRTLARDVQQRAMAHDFNQTMMQDVRDLETRKLRIRRLWNHLVEQDIDVTPPPFNLG